MDQQFKKFNELIEIFSKYLITNSIAPQKLKTHPHTKAKIIIVLVY